MGISSDGEPMGIHKHVSTSFGRRHRTASLLARVNKDADMALLRQIMGKPDLQLNFQSVGGVPNAPWQSAALYTDETGAKYY